MSKACARCQKVVYPIEELKCLDKIWHKTCFKCSECGMTLNMKTYKGFNKLPYCEAHIPKVKATAIADTPELKRIAENTKIQSNVKYHEDFEKAKGKFTQVADDPETLRIKQNTKIISNVAYHGDLEKKAIMEKQREAADLGEITGESEYFSETLAAEQYSQHDSKSGSSYGQTTSIIPPAQQILPQPSQSYQQQQHHQHQQQQHQQQHQQQLAYNQQNYQQPMQLNHNMAPIVNNSQIVSNANYANRNPNQQQQQLQQQQQQQQKMTQPQQQTQSIHSQQMQQNVNHPKQSTYNQLRSTILQSSHHPAGGTMQPSMNAMGSKSTYDNMYDSYEQQQDIYTNPASHPPNKYHPNNANNNSIINNSNVYQMQKSQLQQQQQEYLNDNMNASMNIGKNVYNNMTGGSNLGNNSIHSPSRHPEMQQPLNSGKDIDNSTNMLMKNLSLNSNNGTMIGRDGNNIGKIANYDPLTDGPRQLPNTNRQTTTLVYSSGSTRPVNDQTQFKKSSGHDPLYGGKDMYNQMGNPAHNGNNNQQRQQYYMQMNQQQKQQQQQQQHLQQQHIQQQQHMQKMQQQLQQQQHQSEHHQQQQQQQQKLQQQFLSHQQDIHAADKQQQYAQPQNITRPATRIYRALYAYEAQDTDEVGFRAGDLIYEVESIDSGWMTGFVERTGKTGMLPANYVENVVI